MALDNEQEVQEIKIPARLQHVSAVRRIVADAAQRAGLGREDASDLLLAVSEACNNAIQHGTKGHADASIIVRAIPEPGVVNVEVCDPGTGFDPGDLWEPNSEMVHGRGMLLMMQLTDKMEYTTDNRSTTVRLTKHSRSHEEGVGEGSAGVLASLSRRHSRLYYLFDVCRAVSGTLELPGVLRVVAESTAQLFGVARARVLLHDPRRRTTTVAASWGERLKVRPAGDAPPATRQAIYVAGHETTVGDLHAQPGADPGARAIKSCISVPIISRGEVVGSIHLDNFRRPRRFSKVDVVALRAIAAQTAVAIENARLYREVHRHVEELEALREVARALNASLDLDHILSTILERTRELLGIQVCAVMLLDDEGYLSVRASHGMSEDYISHQRWLLHESPLERALAERRVIATWDLRAHDVPRGLYEGIVSAAAAPMLLNERPIGTLNIYTRERYQFTQDQLRVLGALADHTALAIHNARLYESSQQARSQLEASLERTGTALDGAKDLHEVIRLVAETAAQALRMDGAALVLTDVGVLLGAGNPPIAGVNLPAADALDSLARGVAEQGRPLTLDTLDDEGAREALNAAGIASCLAVPLFIQGSCRGAMCVYSRAPRSHGTRETGLLGSFAAQAATLIENDRLLQDTHLRLEEVGTLLEVGQAIVSKLDLDAVLDQIIGHVSRTMDAAVCSLLLQDRQTGELNVAASCGLDPRYAQRLRLPQGEGVIGMVLRDGEARAVADIRRHSEFVYQDISQGQGLRALLCVPLRTAKEVLGVLNVYRTTAHDWTDAEVKFLSALGTQAAIAIQNATLYQQEQRTASALQRALVPACPPEVEGLEIGQVYAPAGEHEMVGGDYYDFIPVSGDRLGIVIGDVSGKGLRAAVGTAMGKYVLRAYLVENPAPGDVVRRTNAGLRSQFQGEAMFLTLFYALWDPRAHHLTYVNAGHPYPLLWQKRTGKCVPLRSTKTMLLGVLPDHPFTEERLIIQPGDVLLAYTDGLTEARHGRDQFGPQRLGELLSTLVDAPAQTIVESIYREVCEFRDDAAWPDDTTLLAVKFLNG